MEGGCTPRSSSWRAHAQIYSLMDSHALSTSAEAAAPKPKEAWGGNELSSHRMRAREGQPSHKTEELAEATGSL